MASTVWHQLWFLTSETVVVEDLSISTADEARMAFYAGDKTMAVSRNWEPRERPELGSLGIRRYFIRAFETDDSWKVFI